MKALGATVVVVAVLTHGSAPVGSETLMCSTSFQGIRVCTGAGGYVSHEWEWQGRTIGDDSDGRHWMTSQWRGGTITTIAPPGR
jgi:hypothetical protein